MESNPALRYRCKNGHVKLERYKGVDSCVGPCWCGADDFCIEQHPRCACGGNYYIRNDDEASAYCPRCGHKEASNNNSISELDALRQQLSELKIAAIEWIECSKPTREDYRSDEAYQEEGKCYDKLVLLTKGK